MGKWKTVLASVWIALLLCACGVKGGGLGVSEAEELALTIRGQYLAVQEWSAVCQVTADYGQRVYEFEMAVTALGEECTALLTGPETVAGISVTQVQGGSQLALDDLILETGALGDSLTPVTAPALLVETARSGFMDLCALEEQGEETALRIDCRSPESSPGKGQEITLWIQPDTGAILRGEISQDGYRVLVCVFSEFNVGTSG